MKNRLIKMNVDGWKHYYLKNEEGRTIASTNYPFPPESLLLANPYGITLQKLSRDNCEAIELGYDLNEFAEEWIDSNGEKWSNNNNEVGDNYGSFKAGFMKAVETLANNKFTAEDMSTMLLNTTDWMNEQSPDWDANKLLTETIKSLIPTKWEVEIEMETTWVGQCDCPCHSNEVTIMHIMACCNPKMVESSKLDPNGCLILKRK